MTSPDNGSGLRTDAMAWFELTAGIGGLVLVGWILVSQWGGVSHGHPAYMVVLGLTVAVSIQAVLVAALARRRRTPLRIAGRVVLLLLGVGGIAIVGWLRPYSAVEPAITAMENEGAVYVLETPTRIVMHPSGEEAAVGVMFQPGALVDARAYAAHLRPLVEAGYAVYIPKQPLGIAFLSIGAAEDAREYFPSVEQWVLAGHSLGGTVASLEADNAGPDAAGLLLYGSYPATDISGSLEAAVLSLSGSEDGLSTPEDIDASRANLPADAEFVEIEGASHAQFGSYGVQVGDGVPTLTDDDAREQMVAASLEFVESIASY